MVITESGISIEVKLEHRAKTFSPMVVICVPDKSIEVNPDSLKADGPMLVTESGITIEVNPVSLKALPPMLVKLTLVGKVTEVKLVQDRKALFPMVVTG